MIADYDNYKVTTYIERKEKKDKDKEKKKKTLGLNFRKAMK